jgi:hypothetical protein
VEYSFIEKALKFIQGDNRIEQYQYYNEYEDEKSQNSYDISIYNKNAGS